MAERVSTASDVYAGFWIRVWATIVDTLLLVLIIYPLLITAYGWDYFDLAQTGFLAGPLDFLLSWVFPSIAVITLWILKSATPGKMAIGARIVDARTGARPSNGQFIGRYFAYFVSAIPLGLGLIWVAIDSRKQGWHDRLAGTVVVRRVQEQSGLASFERPA
jgi:uncharacterized RDD family membrane protein YckC